MTDKGGREHWNQYSLASSSGASGSGTQSASNQVAVPPSGPSGPSSQTRTDPTRQASYSGGYTSYNAPATTAPSYAVATSPVVATTATGPSPAASTTSVVSTPSLNNTVVTRVRALHNFVPTEQGELAFEKGDVIKVVDRGYKDWWRGQLRGRTGIFPVNYVVR